MGVLDLSHDFRTEHLMSCAKQTIHPYPFGPIEGLELHPYYEHLRQHEPVSKVRMPYGGVAWLVTRYDDIKIVATDRRFSRAAGVGRVIPQIRPVKPLSKRASHILSIDPPEHTRLRKAVAGEFSASRIAALRRPAQSIADELLNSVTDVGCSADLASAFTFQFPVRVMLEMLRLPLAHQGYISTYAHQITDLVNGRRIQEGNDQLDAYVRDLIRLRRTSRSDDIIGRLTAAIDEDQLSEEELVPFSINLLLAGSESLACQLGNCVYTLLSRRELWEELVAHPERIARAVEELLRFVPLDVAALSGVIATEDVKLGGVIVHRGDTVFVQRSVANRDGTIFQRPDEIDLSRVKNPHIAFGYGVHHCIGARLARMELRIALLALVRRLPGLRLAVPADAIPWRSNRTFRSVQALPVTWREGHRS